MYSCNTTSVHLQVCMLTAKHEGCENKARYPNIQTNTFYFMLFKLLQQLHFHAHFLLFRLKTSGQLFTCDASNWSGVNMR